MDPILELAAEHGIAVVEDAACAIGASYKGRKIGSLGPLTCFSLHPRKVITTGEGGMLTTDSAEWAIRMRRLREHGMSVSAAERHASDRPVLEQYLETGYNYRMTDVQAAIGLVQLDRLAGLVAGRRLMAARYHELLADVVGLTPVVDPPYGQTNFQSFWVRLEPDLEADRDAVLAGLAAAGISARRGIMAAHLEPAYAGDRAALPVTERLTRDSLILPLHHALTEDDQDYVVGVLRKLVSR
jgi:perosamine synthetase